MKQTLSKIMSSSAGSTAASLDYGTYDMKIFASEDAPTASEDGLPDVAAIADHPSIKNDSVLYLVLRDRGGSWEAIDVFEPEESE
eukprot:CAMPEP_0197246840 /NCGR_PEP_ID=MMETSP1429-20130617/23496_1 /TAXON_ID=49237 /ORGANISM="Chaetoceros  sp., Strain UNC1202" /LENGTH=84 /DNA_ID=CAMNT_0042707607 /DNA_START=154 /DNA_END=408 /DNA_ORIENTATION=+